MDTNTSEEELVPKIRKPYTITKQRERWTDDEHSRFLEALRLYGRAWQRIEEHIGTKTAVQIRSHAQKFFTKLEKEAQAKGFAVIQALDIEIPPPRPKRKPSTPYPRKLGKATPASHASSSSKDAKLLPSAFPSHGKPALDLEKEPLPEKPRGGEETLIDEENQEDNCSGVFTRLLEAHCSSITSVNKQSSSNKAVLRNPCTCREFVPSLRKVTADDGTSKTLNVDNSYDSHGNALQDLPQMNVDRDGHGVNGLSPTAGTHENLNYPWHVPLHVLNRTMGTCFQNPLGAPFEDFMFRQIGEVHGHSGLFTNPAASATAQNQDNAPGSSHQAFSAFHPAFTPACHTQDDYYSFLQTSSIFSNIVVSTLSQHAAASFAASFWPCAKVGSSNYSSSSTIQTDGEFPPGQMSFPPSMAAIAAATVAAATAWWAAHGLVPICAPFTCSSMPAAVVPPPDSGQIAGPETDTKDTQTPTLENPQRQNPTQSEALQAKNLASKLPASLSADLEETGRAKVGTRSKMDDHGEEIIVAQEELNDSNPTKNKKLVDRSSCGSNTPSGSDLETDTFDKAKKDREDVKEADANQPVTNSSNHRSRSRDNSSSDSWKEVSEEGWLAFQALFSRERLPQSFSPPLNDENGKENSEEKEKQYPDQNPNCKRQDFSSKDEEGANKKSIAANNHERVLMIGLGPGKSPKTRWTRFKPYKRRSVEAKETRAVSSNSRSEEKDSKKIRFEGEAST